MREKRQILVGVGKDGSMWTDWLMHLQRFLELFTNVPKMFDSEQF